MKVMAKPLQKIRQTSNCIYKAKIQTSRQINKQENSHNTYENRVHKMQNNKQQKIYTSHLQLSQSKKQLASQNKMQTSIFI